MCGYNWFIPVLSGTMEGLMNRAGVRYAAVTSGSCRGAVECFPAVFRGMR
jgi:hypothetical protein